MPDQKVQTLQEVSTLLKGSLSTSKIFTTLFITGNKIPRNISTENAALKQAVALSVEAASTSNKLKSGATEIKALSEDVKTYLDRLGNFKSTISLQEAMEQEFSPKRTRMAEMVNERNALLNDLTKSISEQQAAMEKIFTSLSKKEISEDQARQQIKSLGTTQDKIIMASAKLSTAEKTLQAELVDLHKRAKAAADVVAPPSVQEAQRQTPRLQQ